LLGAAYDYTKGLRRERREVHQGILGVDYFLSKRTDLYVDGHPINTRRVRIRPAHAAVADINGLSPSSTSNQVAAVVGIRHKF